MDPGSLENALEHFQAKWTPVRVKKMRQNKNIEPRSDSIGTDKALPMLLQCLFGVFVTEIGSLLI